MVWDRLEKELKEYAEKAKESQTSKCRLVDLNPWLAAFSSLKYGGVLEIPGQYDGREKPQPERHVKIASFGDQVLCKLVRFYTLEAQKNDKALEGIQIRK